MPKKEKSENSKSALAKERKAATQAEKDQADAATKEAALAQDWNQGGKDASRKEEAERKRIEALARKRERELLLADEEKAIAAKTVTPTVKQSKPFTSTSAALRAFSPDGLPQDEFAASGLDNALDLLSITAGSSTADSAIDRHPERRMKSAWYPFILSFSISRLTILALSHPLTPSITVTYLHSLTCSITHHLPLTHHR